MWRSQPQAWRALATQTTVSWLSGLANPPLGKPASCRIVRREGFRCVLTTPSSEISLAAFEYGSPPETVPDSYASSAPGVCLDHGRGNLSAPHTLGTTPRPELVIIGIQPVQEGSSRVRHTDVTLMYSGRRTPPRKLVRCALAVIGLFSAGIAMIGCQSADTRDSGLTGMSVAAGKPVQATVQIYTRASVVPGGGADYDALGYGRLETSLTSDNQGKFRVTLAPGEYVVSATPISTNGRSVKPTYATVRPHRLTDITVPVDAGSTAQP
jgi:hypothetical protein